MTPRLATPMPPIATDDSAHARVSAAHWARDSHPCARRGAPAMDVSMEYNPYAAPTVEDPLLSPGAAGDGAPQPWEVGEVLGLGWEAVKRDWPVLVFAPFLAMVIASIPSMVLAMCVQAGVVEIYSTEYFIA